MSIKVKTLEESLNTNVSRLVKSLAAVIKAPERISLRRWVDTYMYLPATKALGGKVMSGGSNKIVPLVLDLLDSGLYSKIYITAGARVGKTTVTIAVIGREITTTRKQILDVWPDENKLKYQVRTDLANVILASPKFKSFVKDDKEYKQAGSVKAKHFKNGAKVIFANMQSSNDMSGVDGTIILIHELDRAPKTSGSDGDTMTQVEARAKAQFEAIIIAESTPTLEGHGIDVYMNQGTYHEPHFYFPCCKSYQKVVWEYIDENTNEKFGVIYNVDADDNYIKGSSRYKCLGCGHEHNQYEIKRIVYNNDFVEEPIKLIARYPDRTEASVHMGWELTTVFGELEKIVQNYFGAKDDPDKLQGFYNLTLGLPFKPKAVSINDEDLLKRCVNIEPLVAPIGTAMITAAVDKQHDYLAVQIIAWQDNFKRHVMYYEHISGDTRKDEPWNKLFTLLESNVKTMYIHNEKQVSMPIETVFIDSSDDSQFVYQKIYEFNNKCNLGTNKYIAVKGASTFTAPLLKKPTHPDVHIHNQKTKKPIDLISVGVSLMKQRLYAELDSATLTTDRGYTSIYAAAPANYYKELSSEQQMAEQRSDGTVKRWWDAGGRRNEALDTFVYNYLAFMHTAGQHLEFYDYDMRVNNLKNGKSLSGQDLFVAEVAVKKSEITAFNEVKNNRIMCVTTGNLYVSDAGRHVKKGEILDIPLKDFLEYYKMGKVESMDSNVTINYIEQMLNVSTQTEVVDNSIEVEDNSTNYIWGSGG